ncbi:MAG: hypothetical protein JO254_11325 [Pseudolabrys sp.]|nr:hypothetical protein [Pseudolabrys sp.]
MSLLSYLDHPEANQRQTTLVVAGLLAAASASASLIFACATPFAAFAALAVSILPLRHALLAVGASFVVNQIIGFGWLAYPMTADAAAWGVVMALATGLAVLTARAAWQYGVRFGAAVYPLVLIASYAAYEIALYAATPLLGDNGSFAMPIVAQLAFVNAIWMVGLIATYELLHRAGERRIA